MSSLSMYDRVSNSKDRWCIFYLHWSVLSESYDWEILQVWKRRRKKLRALMRLTKQSNYTTFLKFQKCRFYTQFCNDSLKSTSLSFHHIILNVIIVFSNLSRIMNEETSYKILRKLVKSELVQRARKVLTKTLQQRQQSVKKEMIFVNIYQKFHDWFNECKTLLAKMKVSDNIYASWIIRLIEIASFFIQDVSFVNHISCQFFNQHLSVK